MVSISTLLARVLRRLMTMRGIGKRFVYVLRSESNPTKHYVGVTGNVDERIEWHNSGPSSQTVRHRPWSVIVSIEFADERTAIAFERYLKSGSGRAFARRHFASSIEREDRTGPDAQSLHA
jgi:putative endonuclease